MGTHARDVGLMGGSFDPVHVGHLAVAEAARSAFGLERVLFIPAARSPLKGEPRAGNEARVRMLELAAADNAAFRVSDIETRRGGPSFTCETVARLEEENPGTRFFFILGADAFRDLRLWRRAEDLAARIGFLVAPRPGCGEPGDPGLPVRWRPVPCPALDISSSSIRAALAEGRSVRYLVPDPVLEYITTERIYERG